MKMPPLLLGATLVFWGWQSELLIPGVSMALIVESSRVLRARWDFSDEDFSRVWTFCALLFLAAGVFAFNQNNGPASFGDWFQNPGFRTQGGAGLSTARTGAAMFRWMPMIFFPFLVIQLFSSRESLPLATISLIVRRRQRKAKKAGRPIPPSRDVNISWAFFVGTLLAASVHQAEDITYFCGLAVLLTWALWSQRSRRFPWPVWVLTLAFAVGLGFAGQHGYTVLQRYVVSLNVEWLSRLMRRNVNPMHTRTGIGQIGEIKTSGRIVIRLQPKNGSPAPMYLREASYRVYKSQVWGAGSSRDDFQIVNEESPVNSGNWNLLGGRTNTQAVNISCYLEGSKNASAAGLLPLPAGVGRMERLAAYVLSTNSAGAVMAEGPGLLIFDAFYNPENSIDGAPSTELSAANAIKTVKEVDSGEMDRTNRLTQINEDLYVPDPEIAALDAVIAQLKVEGLPRERVLEKVEQYFAANFSYRTWQPLQRWRSSATPLNRFLTETHAGHCEYFATATTLLLRRMGIPARYAVGYAVHETSGSGYVVRLRDAHAWCLVWNPEKQLWDNFDTTPASWFEEEAKKASAFQWLQDAWTWIGFEIAKLRWGQTNLRLYLLIGIVPGLAVLLYQILFRRGRRRKKAGDGNAPEMFNWPGLDSEFYELERRLADRGVVRGSSETLNGWLTRIATTTGLAELSPPLREILRLHYQYRFDPLGLNAADRDVLRQQVRGCLEALKEKEQPAVA